MGGVEVKVAVEEGLVEGALEVVRGWEGVGRGWGLVALAVKEVVVAAVEETETEA